MTETDFAEVARLHNETGGMTWKVGEGSQAGKPLFAVGIPRLAVALYQRTGTAQMARDAWEFLGRPYIWGSWWDAEKGRSVVEVMDLIREKEPALRIARRRRCKCIFDLATGETIRV